MLHNGLLSSNQLQYLDMRSLPKLDDYYIIEGDILLTEEELRGYVLSKSAEKEPSDRSGELIVNRYQGRDDFYSDISKRNLTYVVDRPGFTEGQFDIVRENIHQAAKAWEALCPSCKVSFSDRTGTSPPARNDQVNFVVRVRDLGGRYIAVSFFPHDPPSKRALYIDPVYFSSASTSEFKIGVLRHEIGHILGYRHEHIRGIAGCALEDNQWLPMTPYDPKSVMHYFCGGGGNIKLELSESDKLGHEKLYGAQTRTSGNDQVPAGQAAPGAFELVVRFEGGDIPENAVNVIKALSDVKLIKFATHTVSKNETVQKIYKQHIHFADFSNSIITYASHINDKNLFKHTLQVGEEISYPDVSFSAYDYSRFFDKNSPDDTSELNSVTRHWSHFRVDRQVTALESGAENAPILRIRLRGYRMAIPVDSKPELTTAIKALSDLELKNIQWYFTPSEPSKQRYFSIPQLSAGEEPKKVIGQDVRRFWALVSQPPHEVEVGVQGNLASLVGLSELPESARNCAARCPKIFIIDKPVALHPNMGNAIREGGVEPGEPMLPRDGDGKYVLEPSSFDVRYHGTHLAGIIASQPTGFGLIGINPFAQVFSWHWDSNSPDYPKLLQRLEENIPSGTFPIYLFATRWSYESIPRVGDRYKHPIAKRIHDNKPGALWVVAAGDNGGVGDEVYPLYPYGPMNLGDLPNVIVVTACKDCDTAKPSLMRGTNYSSGQSAKLVHIAAPGDNIPSTINAGKYAATDGTSQATAFVAGIASAMISSYPDVYREPYMVKERLLVTASPFPPVSGDDGGYDNDKVASGILNGSLALRDPATNWIKQNGRPFQQLTSIRWAKTQQVVLDPQTLSPTSAVVVGNIFRIINKDNQLWIYQKGDTNASISKIGPFVVSSEDRTAPLFSTEDGRTFSLEEMEDLLLARPVSTVMTLNGPRVAGLESPSALQSSDCRRSKDQTPLTEMGERKQIAERFKAGEQVHRITVDGTKYLRVRIGLTGPNTCNWHLTVRDKEYRVVETVSPTDFQNSTPNAEGLLTVWTNRITGSEAFFDLAKCADGETPNLLFDQVIAMPNKSKNPYYSSKDPTHPLYIPLYKDPVPTETRRLGDYVGFVMGSWTDGYNADSWCCSGVLIAPDLFLTNWHCGGPRVLVQNGVAKQFPEDAYWGKFMLKDMIIDLSWDDDNVSREYVPTGLVEANQELDFALITVKPLNSLGLAKPATISLERIDAGEPVIIIHHPECMQKQITQDCKIMDARYKSWRSSNLTDFTHDCDTEGGSSGSPIFNLKGELVGLHHLGFDYDPRDCARKDSANKAVRIDKVIELLQAKHKDLMKSLSIVSQPQGNTN